MELSLQEAATVMGKTVRQVRYMVKKGSVPAQKVNGEWRIPKETIALVAGKKRARERKRTRAADIAEDVLRPENNHGRTGGLSNRLKGGLDLSPGPTDGPASLPRTKKGMN